MIKLEETFVSGLTLNYRGLSEEFRGVVEKDTWKISKVNPNGYSFNIVNSFNKSVASFYISDFKDEYTDMLYEGMEFRLWIKLDYILALTEEEFQIEVRKQKEEKIAKEKELEERRKQEYEEKLEESLKRKEINDKFYKRLSMPIKYTPVYMVVGSGLAENSWGDGTMKNTVTHLRVDEDLEDGKRFKRSAGNLLCNQKRKGRRTFWLEDDINCTLDNKEYYRSITCKACLKILKSKGWLKEEE